MLKRLYVDNYKTLVNFTYEPGRFDLLIGGNGSGKSAVGEVLAVLREALDGRARIGEIVSAATLTRWQRRSEQTFAVDIAGPQGLFTYRLDIAHQRLARPPGTPAEPRSRVVREQLTLNGQPLFIGAEGEAQLFRDDHSAGSPFRYDWTRSGLSGITPRHDNAAVTWFKERLLGTVRVGIEPRGMAELAPAEDMWPDAALHNLPSFYRQLAQERPEVCNALVASLKTVFAGFVGLRLSRGTDGRALTAGFLWHAGTDAADVPVDLTLAELSDGQRVLIGLYTLLHWLTADHTLILDEPDNFVALRELQPFLRQLHDHVIDTGGQVLLISHHPELLDQLGSQRGVWFYRVRGGPTQLKEVPASSSPLPLSERIARGELDDA